EPGDVGSAFLVYGMPGGKFGSEINLNSVGTTYRGAAFAMGAGFPLKLGATEGIVSVAKINDLDGDGRPEILIGMPYVEGMYDYFDDDPADDPDQLCCYSDLLPNPLSTGAENDDLTSFD